MMAHLHVDAAIARPLLIGHSGFEGLEDSSPLCQKR